MDDEKPQRPRPGQVERAVRALWTILLAVVAVVALVRGLSDDYNSTTGQIAAALIVVAVVWAAGIAAITLFGRYVRGGGS